MVVCKFFLQGTCKFGNSCRFDHQLDNTGTSILKQNLPQNAPRATTMDPNTLIQSVINDMVALENGKQWIFSSYGPFKDKPTFPGFDDKSFEEIRIGFYEANKTGMIENYKRTVQIWYQEAIGRIKTLQNPNQEIMKLLTQIYNSNQPALSINTGNNNNNNNNNVGNNGGFVSNVIGNNPIFGGNQNNQINQINQNNQNVFGQNSIFTNANTSPFMNQNSIFNNKNPIFGNNNIFGNNQDIQNQQLQNQQLQNQQLQNQQLQTQQLQNQQLQNHQQLQNQQQSLFLSQNNPLYNSQSPFLKLQPSATTPFLSQPNPIHSNIFNNPSNPPQNQPGAFPVQNNPIFANSPIYNQNPIFANPMDANKNFSGGSNVVKPSVIDENIYSKLEDLTQDEIKAFESDEFEFGKIPERPPTLDMCF